MKLLARKRRQGRKADQADQADQDELMDGWTYWHDDTEQHWLTVTHDLFNQFWPTIAPAVLSKPRAPRARALAARVHRDAPELDCDDDAVTELVGASWRTRQVLADIRLCMAQQRDNTCPESLSH